MFERPMTPAQLLRNLKLAVDKDLIAEPGFFTDTNLLKFFGCNDIRRAPGDASIKHFALQDAFLTACDAHFPDMTVQVEQGLSRTGDFDPTVKPLGHFRGPITRFAYIHMVVEEIPEISVGAIRTVFGTETKSKIGGGWASDGGIAPETSKGSLLYGTTDEVLGKSDDKELKFVIKLPAPGTSYDAQDPRKRDRTIHDTDAIAGIFVYVPEPRKAEPSLTDRMSQFERPASTIELDQVVGSSDVSQGVRACGGRWRGI